MTRFRPCIDLHAGQVKQIVGGTLTTEPGELKTNYVSKLPAGHYAKLYRENGLIGGHVVMLGPGNDNAAKEALQAWPDGLHVAGGITESNAQYWLDAGAEKVWDWSNPVVFVLFFFTADHAGWLLALNPLAYMIAW